MEPEKYAVVLVRQWQGDTVEYLTAEIEKALAEGDDVQALYLDSVLQHVESMPDIEAKSA
ncbi:MAG: hypothetical protein R3E11_08195 [Sphingobium sp.]|mgnify:CR=1 FL=1|jgi:predicted RNase H-like HicB family nuclease|nr:hypothetical protein [Sphingobium sp.]MCP5397880.1 hypothetical protein [Sphingomonas sp.]